jgi:DNA repair exonuclease SbcCD ATPase subunit
LALLSLPSAEEREAFIEENNVDEMTTRELQQAIREKQEAERKLGDEKKQREQAEDLLKTQDQMLVEARAQIEELAKLNKELENRPHEVAVETVRDEEAIAAAAKEAREKAEAEAVKQANKLNREHDKTLKELHEKLEALKKERDMLVKEAETTGSDADTKIAAAEAEAARIRTELEEAQRKLKASSADVAKFGVWFSTVQQDFLKMMEALREVRERDPETGEKLKRGAVTLLQNLLERMSPEAE